MKTFSLRALYLNGKNGVKSQMMRFSLGLCLLVGMLQLSGGCVLDRLFLYQGGIPYLSIEKLDLGRLMIWLLPHLLFSIFVGKQMSDSMASLKYQLIRYRSLARWWIAHLLETYALMVIYYGVSLGGVALLSYLTGSDMPGITGGYIAMSDQVRANIDDTRGLALLLARHTLLPMLALITLQISVHLLTKDERAAGGVFLVTMMLSIFFPASWSNFSVGSWMMLARGADFSPVGYSAATLLLGCAALWSLTCGATWIAIRNIQITW